MLKIRTSNKISAFKLKIPEKINHCRTNPKNAIPTTERSNFRLSKRCHQNTFASYMLRLPLQTITSDSPAASIHESSTPLALFPRRRECRKIIVSVALRFLVNKPKVSEDFLFVPGAKRRACGVFRERMTAGCCAMHRHHHPSAPQSDTQSG